MLSKNRCTGNEVEVTTTTTNPADGTSCWTGHMSLCCEHTASDSDDGQCSTYTMLHHLFAVTDERQNGSDQLHFAPRRAFYSVRSLSSRLTLAPRPVILINRPLENTAQAVSSHVCTMAVSNRIVAKILVSFNGLFSKIGTADPFKTPGQTPIAPGTKGLRTLGRVGLNLGSLVAYCMGQ